MKLTVAFGARSRTPQLVEEDFYGLLPAHFAGRDLMHEAARGADRDPDG